MNIPNSVTSIMPSAFEGCSSLTSVNIPNSVTYISDDAFLFCSSLTSINVDTSHQHYSSISGILFDKTQSTIVCYPAGKTENFYTIPNSVTSIGGLAFEGCSALTSISILDSITSIGGGAFYKCSSLANINIPNSVTSIGEWAFSGCSSLTIVSIPNSITSIGDYVFWDCSALTSISIPNSVTSIGELAFNNCSSLKDVYYSGSEAQWKQISIGDYNEYLTNATIHYHTDFVVNPNTGKDGDFDAYFPAVNTDEIKSTAYEREERIRNAAGEVWEAAKKLNKSYNEYLEALKTEAKNQSESELTLEDKGKLLMEKDKNSKYKYLLCNDNEDVKLAAYMALAEYFEERLHYADLHINKFNLNDPKAVIDYNMTQDILGKISVNTRRGKYNGYNITFHAISISNSGTGGMYIQGKGKTVSATYATDPNTVMEELNVLLKSMQEVTKDTIQQAATSLFTELSSVTGFDDFIKKECEEKITSAVKTLSKHGFGKKLLKIIKRCSDGYDLIKDIVDIKNKELGKDSTKLIDALSNAEDIYKKAKNLDYSDSSVESFIIKEALNKVQNAMSSFNTSLIKYINQYGDEERKSAFEIWWENLQENGGLLGLIGIQIHCPVDFTVYDENENVLGYVRNGEIYSDGGIYIETNGDMKTLYYPKQIKIRIEMNATEDGEFDYILEEYNDDGQPVGRLNYYNIPFSEGEKFTQILDNASVSDDLSSIPIEGEHKNINASEYLSADEAGFITVIVATDGHGNGTGSGNYIIGDAVELMAIPEQDYILDGWYLDGELVSTDVVYRFTARENLIVQARFIPAYTPDDRFDTLMSPDYRESFYAYVYRTSDGGRGIVMKPFKETSADELEVYLTAYDENNNPLSIGNEYTLTKDDYGQYFAKIPALASSESFTLTDVNGVVITTAETTSEPPVKVLGEYYGEILVTDINHDMATLTLEALEDGILEYCSAYAAKYDENGVLTDVKRVEPSIENDTFVYTYEAGYKLMIWDDKQCPLIEAVSPKLF